MLSSKFNKFSAAGSPESGRYRQILDIQMKEMSNMNLHSIFNHEIGMQSVICAYSIYQLIEHVTDPQLWGKNAICDIAVYLLNGLMFCDPAIEISAGQFSFHLNYQTKIGLDLKVYQLFERMMMWRYIYCNPIPQWYLEPKPHF